MLGNGEWPPSVVVWPCHHYAVLYGFESRHSPHLSRLPGNYRLMSHEPSSLCQTHHRSSIQEISNGGGLGGVSMALCPPPGSRKWEGTTLPESEVGAA